MGRYVSTNVALGVAVDFFDFIKLLTPETYAAMKEMIQKGAIESIFDTDSWFFKLCDSLEELDQNDYEELELWIARQCIKLERLVQRQDCYEKDTVSNKMDRHDFVIQLMQNGVFCPKVVYFSLNRLLTSKQEMPAYYKTMHAFGNSILNIGAAMSIISCVDHYYYQMSICRDFTHVKPLLRWWEECWKMKKPVNAKNQFLMSLGYITHPKEKRKILRKKYNMCAESVLPLFFCLKQLDLPVLLQTYLYYFLCEPVSDSVDLHIVDQILVEAKKAQQK